jgi:small redox-active disulfide protein 2
MTTHKIQILGTGCAKCLQLTKMTTAVADDLGIPYELEKVTDFLRFADFGVMVTPALVVDGKVLAAGKVPGQEELRRLLQPTSREEPK